MKACLLFGTAAALCLIAVPCLPMSAWAYEDDEYALDQELRWIQAEAQATVSIATKTEMGVNEAPSIVSVITEEEIRNSGAKDIEDLLRQVAGFHTYRSSGYPNIVADIRGIGAYLNPGVKIMVNGYSMEDPGDQNTDRLITFPVELIRKIEIIRGPGSALYGTSAMNGVINIITKDSDSPSQVSAAYGSFGTSRGTAQLSHKGDDLGLYFFADIYRSDGDPQLIEKDMAWANFSGHSAVPGYTNEKFAYRSLFTSISYKDFRFTGFFRDSDSESPVGIARALTDETEIPDKAVFAQAEYQAPLTERTRLSAKAYWGYGYSDLRYEMLNEETSAQLGFPAGEGIVMKAENKVDKFGAEIMADSRVSDSLNLVAGLLWEYAEGHDTQFLTNANMIGKPMILDGVTYMPMQYLGGVRDVTDSYNFTDEERTERTLYAGYVQGTWDMTETFPFLTRIGKNLTITAGLRYDSYDDVGDTLNPRVGLTYAPNNSRLFFKLLYGEAFRGPGFMEMYTQNNSAGVGNPDLDPETVKTAEFLAGIRLTEHITATLDLFSVKKENEIRVDQGVFSNWGRVESRGAEGEIRISYDEDTYGYFNVTFQKVEDRTHERMTDSGGAEYVQEDFNFGMYPRVMANLGVNTRIGRHVNANLSVNHTGSVERFGRMRFTADTDDPDGTVEKSDKRDPMDSRTLVNLSLRFGDFDFAPGWEFQITGYNIFDADHRDPELDSFMENDFPRWDRHFLGKLTYTF